MVLRLRELTAEERAAAERLRLDADTIRGWTHGFDATGLTGLEDRPRAGRPPSYVSA